MFKRFSLATAISLAMFTGTALGQDNNDQGQDNNDQGTVVHAPEFSPGTAASALALLVGGSLIVLETRSRRRKS